MMSGSLAVYIYALEEALDGRALVRMDISCYLRCLCLYAGASMPTPVIARVPRISHCGR